MTVVKVWNAWEVLAIEAGKCRWELNTSEKAVDGCKGLVFGDGTRYAILNSMELKPPSEAFAHLKKLADQSLCEFCKQDSARHRQLMVAWKLKLNEAMCSYLSSCLAQQKDMANEIESHRRTKQNLDVEVANLKETIAHLKVKPYDFEVSHVYQALTIKNLRKQISGLLHERELHQKEMRDMKGQLESQIQALEIYKAGESELVGYKSEVFALRSKLKEWSEFGNNMKKDFDKHCPFTPPLYQVPQSDKEKKRSSNKIPTMDAAKQQPSSPTTAKVPLAKCSTPEIRLPESNSRAGVNAPSGVQESLSATGSKSTENTGTGAHFTSSTTTPLRKEGLSQSSATPSPNPLPNKSSIFGTPTSSPSQMRLTKSYSNLSETPAPGSTTSAAIPSFRGSLFEFSMSPSFTTPTGTPSFSSGSEFHGKSASDSSSTPRHKATSSSSAIPSTKSQSSLFGASSPTSSSKTPLTNNTGIFGSPISSSTKSETREATSKSPQPPTTPSSSFSTVFGSSSNSPNSRTPTLGSPPSFTFGSSPSTESSKDGWNLNSLRNSSPSGKSTVSTHSRDSSVADCEKTDPLASPRVFVPHLGATVSSSSSRGTFGSRTPSVSSTTTLRDSKFFGDSSGATTPLSTRDLFGSTSPKSTNHFLPAAGETFESSSSIRTSPGSGRE